MGNREGKRGGSDGMRGESRKSYKLPTCHDKYGE